MTASDSYYLWHNRWPREIPVALLALLFVLSPASFAQKQLAVVKDDRISECSGLAISRQHDNAVWMHNDSGGQPRLFLVDFDGNTRSVCHIEKAKAVDWEDMCSFEVDGEPWLLIADVGDNDAKRSRKKNPCTLYLLHEPTSSKRSQAAEYDIRLQIDYEDGPHNCEGVAVDTERKEILLVSKESPLTAALYRLPLDLQDGKQQRTATRVGSFPVPFATALDIAPDGQSLLAVNMWHGVLIRRKAEQSWKDALSSHAKQVTLPKRRQGESVCFSRDGQSFFVNSERKRQPLWRLDAPR